MNTKRFELAVANDNAVLHSVYFLPGSYMLSTSALSFTQKVLIKTSWSITTWAVRMCNQLVALFVISNICTVYFALEAFSFMSCRAFSKLFSFATPQSSKPSDFSRLETVPLLISTIHRQKLENKERETVRKRFKLELILTRLE